MLKNLAEEQYLKGIFLLGEIFISLYDFLCLKKIKAGVSQCLVSFPWEPGEFSLEQLPSCQGEPQPSRRPLARNLAMSNKCSAFILTLLAEFDWNYICPDNTQQSALLTFVSRYIWKHERWPWAQLLFQFRTSPWVYRMILPNTAKSPNGKTF